MSHKQANNINYGWMDGYSQKKMINNFADNGGPFIEDRIGFFYFFFAHFRTCVVNKKKIELHQTVSHNFRFVLINKARKTKIEIQRFVKYIVLC